MCTPAIVEAAFECTMMGADITQVRPAENSDLISFPIQAR